MRIIAGINKGMRLLPPKGMDTRPITDRVKESLFSILYTKGMLEDRVVAEAGPLPKYSTATSKRRNSSPSPGPSVPTSSRSPPHRHRSMAATTSSSATRPTK